MPNIIKKLNLLKKNERVYYSNERDASSISYDEIKDVLSFALNKNVTLFRICFHQNDDEHINEMIMFHTRPQKVGPLKQSNKSSISYLVLEGEATINLMDNQKKVFKEINLSSFDSSKSRFCRLDSGIWRTIESTSNNFIFLEVAAGPFKDSDTIWLDKK
jgi:cupin fold WbuC family metalloprotein